MLPGAGLQPNPSAPASSAKPLPALCARPEPNPRSLPTHRGLDDVAREVPLLLPHRPHQRIYALAQPHSLLSQGRRAQALQLADIQAHALQGGAEAAQGALQSPKRKRLELPAWPVGERNGWVGDRGESGWCSRGVRGCCVGVGLKKRGLGRVLGQA